MAGNCLAGCCPHFTPEGGAGPGAARGCPADIPAAELPERVAHLYSCQGLSTYRIADVVRISRQRVTRMLHASAVPVKPSGAGRQRPGLSRDPYPAETLARLYLHRRLSCAQISELTGIPARTVRERLVAAGVPMRTKGRGSREDRLTVDSGALEDLYFQAGMTAAQTGNVLGVSHRIVLRSAHDQGLPVRMGGAAPQRGPAEIELIEALYAHPDVKRALRKHGVPAVPAGGPIWQRFPAPVRVSAELATELYVSCGLATTHIELLTGQPSATIRHLLRQAEVPLRPAGGRSPFLRQWRASGGTARPGGAAASIRCR